MPAWPSLTLVAAALVLAGCLGTPDSSPPAVIAPGATEGRCEALLANATGPVAVVLVEDPRGVDSVEGTVDGETITFAPVDDEGCAAIPFARTGFYRFHVWSQCNPGVETHWDGTHDLEVRIPDWGDACV